MIQMQVVLKSNRLVQPNVNFFHGGKYKYTNSIQIPFENAGKLGLGPANYIEQGFNSFNPLPCHPARCDFHERGHTRKRIALLNQRYPVT